MTKSKEQFLEELDRSIVQADSGDLRNAHEAIDDICAELEAGYKAMMSVRKKNQQRRGMVGA